MHPAVLFLVRSHLNSARDLLVKQKDVSFDILHLVDELNDVIEHAKTAEIEYELPV